jgi:cob(I)alamin adenosyltransferase
LQPLRQFILPGGTAAAAQLHLARAVARRAERHCVSLFRTSKAIPGILRYLNRLSDLCFVMARYESSAIVSEQHPAFKILKTFPLPFLSVRGASTRVPSSFDILSA